MNNKTLGNLGERLAGEFLERKGYEIVERNYRTKWSEIDLICKDEGDLVFVEVKTRIDGIFGTPEDAINKDKMRRLIKNANAYVMFKKIDNYRIDAVCITLDKNSTDIKSINHYKNITI